MSEYEKAALEFLRLGIIEARAACWTGNPEKAAAILDALHNVPGMLAGTDAISASQYESAYLRPLRERYPEVEWWAAKFPSEAAQPVPERT